MRCPILLQIINQRIRVGAVNRDGYFDTLLERLQFAISLLNSNLTVMEFENASNIFPVILHPT